MPSSQHTQKSFSGAPVKGPAERRLIDVQAAVYATRPSANGREQPKVVYSNGGTSGATMIAGEEVSGSVSNKLTDA
jgi:hypothetical protein